MNVTLSQLDRIFENLWSDIDSLNEQELVDIFNKYYGLLVHKDNKNDLKELSIKQYSMLQAHYDGLQSYIMWLRDLYSGYRPLIDAVATVQGGLHKILQKNGVLAHENGRKAI